MPRQEGAFLVEDFYANLGGLNSSDSPFLVDPTQPTDGYNYCYTTRGAITKRGGHLRLNTTADTQLKTIGMGLFDKPSVARAIIRATASQKIQNFDYSAHTFKNLYDDAAAPTGTTVTITIASPGVVSLTAHGFSVTDPVVFTTTGALPTGLVAGTIYYVSVVVSANAFQVSATANGASINTSGTQSGTQKVAVYNTLFLANSTSVPVVRAMFNTPSVGILWMVGGGQATGTLYGAYSSTQITKNGSDVPTVASVSLTPHTTGGTLAAGYYTYSFAARKLSTQALSNCATDTDSTFTAQISTGTSGSMDISVSFTSLDLTKYDQIWIYRSSVQVASSGSPGFTAGSLVAQVTAAATVTWTEQTTVASGKGPNVSSSVNVPRVGNLVLDNSVLPSTGTYTSAVVFKQRLVTATGTSVLFSDINKSESWPSYQVINVPSGGAITGLAKISFASGTPQYTDEYLCVFKQRELWIITGDGIIGTDSLPNWSLKYIDSSGCPSQSLIVGADGFLFWVNYKGIYTWDGSSKPTYISRPIEDKWADSGDLDRSKLIIGYGEHIEKRHEVQWVLSSSKYGENALVIVLDLRLTLAPVSVFQPKKLDGVFYQEVLTYPLYGGLSFVDAANSTTEDYFTGDAAGYIYQNYANTADGVNAPVVLQYYTPFLNLNTPCVAKRLQKVIVWILDNGSYNLEVDIWSNYRYAEADKTSLTQASDASGPQVSSLWDATTSLWDAVKWDAASFRVVGLTYNVSSIANNGEGDAFRLRFQEAGTTTSPLIYGFSLYYSELPLRK